MSKPRAKHLVPVVDMKLRRSRNVVKCLETILEMAKRGEIAAVALAYEITPGSTGGWRVSSTRGASRCLLVGLLECAKHDVMELP